MAANLHGTIYVVVYEAAGLLDQDGWFAGKSDPFVRITLDDRLIGRTYVRPNTDEPVWNQALHLFVSEECSTLRFQMLDRDDMDDADPLGWYEVACTDLLNGWSVDDWVDLNTPEGMEGPAGRMRIRCEYRPQEAHSGLEVPDVHFPLRQGCRMTLFQDAHTDGEPRVTVNEDPMFLPPHGCKQLFVSAPDESVAGMYALQDDPHNDKPVWFHADKGIYLYSRDDASGWDFAADIGGDPIAYSTSPNGAPIHANTPIGTVIYGVEEEGVHAVQLGVWNTLSVDIPDDRISGLYVYTPDETCHDLPVWFNEEKGVYLYAGGPGPGAKVWSFAKELGAINYGRLAYAQTSKAPQVCPVGIHIYVKTYGGPGDVEGLFSPTAVDDLPIPGGDYARYLHADSPHEYQAMDDRCLRGGLVDHVPRNLWEEMYIALSEAQKFIYITGWSVWVNMSLLRRRPVIGDEMLTTGELLKKKAAEGVRVIVMPWNEATSWSNPHFPRTEGMMGTHDEETMQYFQDTGVECRLAYRKKGDILATTYTEFFGSGFTFTPGENFLWTHHQKTVICDATPLQCAPQEDGQRRIISFVGGIDITNGRWDTPSHTIYRSLQTEHAADFCNNVNAGLQVTHEYGPREPWEDLHAKIEGPLARDVAKNFVERFSQHFAKQVELLVDLEDTSTFVSPEDDVVLGPKHPDTWACQLFRSIDEDCALEVNGIDKSIQWAYCHHIRRAKHFLFLENQYFLGSSQWWSDPCDTCPNLVPIEITRKVIQKIQAGEPFCAYIMIPMYPEGDPESKAVQEVLKWQYHTICMMYAKIAAALAEAGSDSHPLDYLAFFCLGNRETLEGSQHTANHEEPSGQPTQDVLNASRRTMIYVHSKMIIVDDEMCMLGSANINERSLAGSRDTEITVAGYQPAHVTENYGGDCPRGRVHAYRLQLWKEHTGLQEKVFLKPGTVQCMHRIREIAQQNWELYVGDEVVDLPSHLLPYPYLVEADGTVTGIVEHFPDTQGPVIGTQTGLPNIITA